MKTEIALVQTDRWDFPARRVFPDPAGRQLETFGDLPGCQQRVVSLLRVRVQCVTNLRRDDGTKRPKRENLRFLAKKPSFKTQSLRSFHR